MNLTAKNISLTLNEKPILNNMDIHVRNQEFVGLLGPNGSGKSTFLKSIYRTMKPDVGWISLANQDIYQLPPRKVAQQMAVVRQETAIEFDFTVREMVMMGRFPHKSALQQDTKQDEQLVYETLAQVGMQDFAERSFTTLSGGEKQRVLIARALAQQAKFLVLDEPTNHLDIHSQLQIMAILKKLGCTVLTALHDLNIASVYCDRIYLVKSGEIVASGTPSEIFQPPLIRKVFGVECEVSIHPRTLKPHIVFLSAIDRAM